MHRLQEQRSSQHQAENLVYLICTCIHRRIAPSVTESQGKTGSRNNPEIRADDGGFLGSPRSALVTARFGGAGAAQPRHAYQMHVYRATVPLSYNGTA